MSLNAEQEAARVLVPGGWLVLIDGTVPNNEPEAAAWAHEVEKLRDPSHGRLIPPAEWHSLCKMVGLTVERSEISRLKQPDLEWYFETAATSEAKRAEVKRLVAEAPEAAKRAFDIATQADGKVVWQWHRLHLAARK